METLDIFQTYVHVISHINALAMFCARSATAATLISVYSGGKKGKKSLEHRKLLTPVVLSIMLSYIASVKHRIYNIHAFIVVLVYFQINMDVIHEFFKEEIEEEKNKDIDTKFFLPYQVVRNTSEQVLRNLNPL